MASEGKHLQQYKRNKDLLNEKCFNIDSSPHLDWVVTILFYAAVHLIEKELAKVDQHCGNHMTRNNAIIKVKSLKPISSAYLALYMESRKARYECTTFNSDRVKEIITLFNKIEGDLFKAS